MATVLDAFIVTLGLDPAGFESGEKAALAALDKLKQASNQALAQLKAAQASMAAGGPPPENLKQLERAAMSAARAFEDGQKRMAEMFKKTEQEADHTASHLQEKGKEGAEFFSQMAEKALAFFAVIAGGMEMKEFFKHTVEAEAKTLRLAGILKVGVEELGAWSEAARFTGGSVEGFQSSVMALGEKLSVLGTKLRGAKMAAMALTQVLGPDAEDQVKGKGVFEVLDMLSGKLEGMDKLKALKLGQYLGIDQGTILMLAEGNEEFKKRIQLMKELGVPTKEEAESSKELHHAMMELEVVQGAVGRIIVEQLKPAVLWLVEKFEALTKWAKEHPAAVKIVFAAIVGGLGAATVAMLAFTASAFHILGPITLISAAVAALSALVIYLYEDWKQWSEGGESALGDLFQAFKDFVDEWLPVLAFWAGYTTAAIEDVSKKTIPLLHALVDASRGDYAQMQKHLEEWVTGSKEGAKKHAEGWKESLEEMLDKTMWWVNLIRRAWMFSMEPLLAGPKLLIAGIEKLINTEIGAINAAWHALWASMGVDIDHVMNTALNKLGKLGSVLRKLLTMMGIVVPSIAIEGEAPSGPPRATQSGMEIQGSGIAGVSPVAPHVLPTMPAPHATMAQHPTSVVNSQSRSIHSEVHVDKVEITTQATDAQGMAKESGPALKQHWDFCHAETGMR